MSVFIWYSLKQYQSRSIFNEKTKRVTLTVIIQVQWMHLKSLLPLCSTKTTRITMCHCHYRCWSIIAVINLHHLVFIQEKKEITTRGTFRGFFLCPFIFAEPAVFVGHGIKCGSVLPVWSSAGLSADAGMHREVVCGGRTNRTPSCSTCLSSFKPYFVCLKHKKPCLSCLSYPEMPVCDVMYKKVPNYQTNRIILDQL